MAFSHALDLIGLITRETNEATGDGNRRALIGPTNGATVTLNEYLQLLALNH